MSSSLPENSPGGHASTTVNPPTSTTRGGVLSSAAPTNQFATGIDATGTINYAQVNFANLAGISLGQTPATSTNDSASAGNVGEYSSSTLPVASAIGMTTNSVIVISSVALTSGDWDVWGNMGYFSSTLTVTSLLQGAISSNSATMPSNTSPRAIYAEQNVSFTNYAMASPVGSTRVLLATSATIYLLMQATFVTSTASAYGDIEARRRR